MIYTKIKVSNLLWSPLLLPCLWPGERVGLGKHRPAPEEGARQHSLPQSTPRGPPFGWLSKLWSLHPKP